MMIINITTNHNHKSWLLLQAFDVARDGMEMELPTEREQNRGEPA